MVIVGGAQAVNVLISIGRMKVLALLLGPSGIGILSIYSNLQGTAAALAGLGMPSSGVRQIAKAKGEETEFARARIALLGGLLIQGLLALAMIWLLREPLAKLLFDDASRSTEVGLVGIAVMLTLMSSSQTALLQGMRRIGDLGRVTVIGALGGTLAGLLAVWLSGEDGLIAFIIVQPLVAFLVALLFTRKIPRERNSRLSRAALWQAWAPMARLGAVFMLGGLATSATLLLVRAMLVDRFGLAGVGLFAASWAITMQYVGFLLTAMSADYYPRLAEIVHEPEAASRLMNDQVQLAIALGGPVLLAMIGLAPWVMALLYAPSFAPAADILQWQTLGNVFKLASWPVACRLCR